MSIEKSNIILQINLQHNRVSDQEFLYRHGISNCNDVNSIRATVRKKILSLRLDLLKLNYKEKKDDRILYRLYAPKYRNHVKSILFINR